MDLMGKDLDLIKLHKGWVANEYNRSPGEGPMRVGVPIADLTAGYFVQWGYKQH